MAAHWGEYLAEGHSPQILLNDLAEMRDTLDAVVVPKLRQRCIEPLWVSASDLKQHTEQIGTSPSMQNFAKGAPITVPAGYQLTPIEPTDEMYTAGYNVLRETHAGAFGGAPSLGQSGLVFRAMLAAAPSLDAPVYQEPSECQMAPVQPTAQMYVAGYDVLREIHAGPFGGSPSLGHAGAVFRAMLTVA
jgi:hypothetical protein